MSLSHLSVAGDGQLLGRRGPMGRRAASKAFSKNAALGTDKVRTKSYAHNGPCDQCEFSAVPYAFTAAPLLGILMTVIKLRVSGIPWPADYQVGLTDCN